ncbi:MAG: hypothetical protein WEC75_02400 [Dehalococcoidia bacterium]
MNPLASHWFRIGLALLVLSPLVAFLVAAINDVPFGPAIVVTLYLWLVVCVILALIAAVGMVVRLVGRGVRALRR